jgi:hypothetical protein
MWPTSENVASAGDKRRAESSSKVVPSFMNHKRLWGPILAAEAEACGALAPVASVLLEPTRLHSVAQSVNALLPDALFPHASDTADSLASRLSASDFLDPIVVRDCGNGRRGLVPLNETKHAQPRRVSWSVTFSALGADGNPELQLLQYPHAYHQSVHCRPMPMPVFNLGVELWRVAWPYLTEVCLQSPPDHCELLCYYTLFNSSMGRHRDNFSPQDLAEYFVSGKDPRSGAKRAQLADSNVLIWSVGNAPMTLHLSFPRSIADAGKAKLYVKHPTLSFRLCGGTLFVFAPLDDLFFCHECCFSSTTPGHRFSFVYRWLRTDCLRGQSLPASLPSPAACRLPQETLPQPQLGLRGVRAYKHVFGGEVDKGLKRGLRLLPPPATGVPSPSSAHHFFADSPAEGRVRWRPLMVAQSRLLGPAVYELPPKLKSYDEYTLYADREAGWMLLGNPHTDAWALINGASPPFEANAVLARVQHLVHPDELVDGNAAPDPKSGAWVEFTLMWILQVAELGLNGEIRLDYGNGFAGDWSRAVYGRGIPEADGPQLVAYSKAHFHRQVSAMDILQYGFPSDRDGQSLRSQYFSSLMPRRLELLDADPVCVPMTYLE